MRYNIALFVCSLTLLGCSSEPAQQSPDHSSSSTSEVTEDTPKTGRITYAVIWHWTTSDVGEVEENSPVVSKQLAKLWNEDIIENAYFGNDPKTNKLANFPSISFFLKAHSEHEAKGLLDKLTIVRKGLAAYTLYPVGGLWLDRKGEIINEKGITPSYATVWSTVEKPSEAQTVAQHDHTIDLWKKGRIENVYFDIEGTQEDNNKTDFVFFANADTEEEAHALCKSFPFYQEHIATYELFPAGIFWMGKHSEN